MVIKTMKVPLLILLMLICLAGGARAGFDGRLDRSFNDPHGYVLFNNSADERDRGVEVAIQSDGKIVVLGYSHNGVNEDVLLVRYNGDGSLDSGFGAGGYVTYDGGANDRGLGLALQADGKIVAAGFTYAGGQRDVLVLRYTAGGAPDSSFGAGGVVTYSSAGAATDIGFGVAIQSDGRIVVAGETSNGVNQDALILRLTASGALDATFGVGGVYTYAGPGGMDRAFAAAIRSDGKIVVAGASVIDTRDDVLVFRLQPNGSLDATFGTDGVFTYSGPGDNYDFANALALRSDGRIVVLGAQSNGAAYDALLLQLTSSGALDTAFGAGGVVVYGDGSSMNDYGLGLAIQPNGKIVMAGYTQAATDDVLVVRFHADGRLDYSFGSGGAFIWNGPGNGTDYGQAVALQSDGRIVVAGFSDNGVNEDVLVMRLRSYYDDDEVRCIIVLAMMDSGRHDQLAALRNFRDRYLMPYRFGRMLVRLYYGVSTFLAGPVTRHDYLKSAVRGLLAPVVWAVNFPCMMLLIMTAGVMISLRVRLRRRIRSRADDCGLRPAGSPACFFRSQ